MEKDGNLFEHDYIIQALGHFIADLHTSKPLPSVLDKHACILTAFMQGQLCETRNKLEALKEEVEKQKNASYLSSPERKEVLKTLIEQGDNQD
jgi:hypothetical protein